MSKIVAIANQKGGVGKTTTAINLGAALGALEKRVLLVDCDPQGNATRGLGLQAEEPNLLQVLMEQTPASEAVRRTSFPGMSLLPADRELVGVEVEFARSSEGNEVRLRLASVLEDVRDGHDVVFLDCPPSLGFLTLNALTAADAVLVPLQCEYYALEGISELFNTIRHVQGHLNPQLGIGGVLLTMYDDRTNLSKDVADEARRFFEDKVFEAVIPRNIRLAEAPSHGMPILQYAIKSRGANAYLALAREFLGKILT